MSDSDFHINGFVLCCIVVEGLFPFVWILFFVLFLFFVFIEIETQLIEWKFSFKNFSLTNLIVKRKIAQTDHFIEIWMSDIEISIRQPRFGNRTSLLDSLLLYKQSQANLFQLLTWIFIYRNFLFAFHVQCSSSKISRSILIMYYYFMISNCKLWIFFDFQFYHSISFFFSSNFRFIFGYCQ